MALTPCDGGDGLSPAEVGVNLLQGNITSLECYAVVNAVNSALPGCFLPFHN
ncbi:MAG: hypothetical protein K5647_01875 [Clostridiales bacterium]|nr:hypothetical protein [Clostridiales bacterium]